MIFQEVSNFGFYSVARKYKNFFNENNAKFCEEVKRKFRLTGSWPALHKETDNSCWKLFFKGFLFWMTGHSYKKLTIWNLVSLGYIIKTLFRLNSYKILWGTSKEMKKDRSCWIIFLVHYSWIPPTFLCWCIHAGINQTQNTLLYMDNVYLEVLSSYDDPLVVSCVYC